MGAWWAVGSVGFPRVIAQSKTRSIGPTWIDLRPATGGGSKNRKQLPQDARRAARDLIDELGEVEAGVLAGEIGQRADLQPGYAEALGDLGKRAALHGHRLGLELAMQPLP